MRLENFSSKIKLLVPLVVQPLNIVIIAPHKILIRLFEVRFSASKPRVSVLVMVMVICATYCPIGCLLLD